MYLHRRIYIYMYIYISIYKYASTSSSLTMLKPLTVWITINCGKLL